MDCNTTQVNQYLLDLMKQSDNLICFDCGNPGPIMASSNNGIFLCQMCAVTHQSMNPQTSFVRSIYNQNWTNREITMMHMGGNAKLKQYFGKFGLNSPDMSSTRYSSQASCVYRIWLDQLGSN